MALSQYASRLNLPQVLSQHTLAKVIALVSNNSPVWLEIIDHGHHPSCKLLDIGPMCFNCGESVGEGGGTFKFVLIRPFSDRSSYQYLF